MWADSQLLGDCNSPTCCGRKKNSYKGGEGNEHLKPGIFFFFLRYSPATAPLRQETDPFFYGTLLLIPDPYGRVRTYLRLQTPTQRQMSGLRKQLVFYLFIYLFSSWCDLTALRLPDWMPWLPPSPVSHTGRFWTLPQLTSQRTDKWIDRVKMAEEVAATGLKMADVSSSPPPPPPTPTPTTIATTQQIKLSGII